MPSSQTDICNMAIGWLGGNLITSIDDDSDEANLCKANYEASRDAVLEDRDWNFATTRGILSPKKATPSYGYEYEFNVPTDCIRILRCGSEPSLRTSLDWVREGKVIRCDITVLYIKYIARITDETLFSAGFVPAFASRLAMDIALPLTESPDMQQQMAQQYAVKLERAGTMDGMQGKNVQIAQNCRLIRVR